MKHIIEFYYILTFASGIAGIVIAVFLNIKSKSKTAKYYLICQLLLTALVVSNNIYFYIFSIVPYQNVYLEMFFAIIFFLIFGGLIYIIPFLLYSFLGKKLETYKKVIFIFLSLFSIIFLLIPYFISQDKNKVLQFLWMELYSIYINIFYAVSIFTIIDAIINLKTIKNPVKRRILKASLILIILSFPLFILDGYWWFFQVKLQIFPRNFNFMPLFYFIWNMLSIIYSAKYYFFNETAPASISLIEIPETFLKQYEITEREKEVLILILKGYSYSEISGKLFISPGTIKNYAYNIYKKTGVNNKMALMNLIHSFNPLLQDKKT